MLDYLNRTLGIAARETAWDVVDRLPLFLKADRRYSLLSVETTEYLLIYMEARDFNLSAYHKQLNRLREYWQNDVIFCFDRLTAYQRKVLIDNKLSFIVPGSQIYLPCLGIVLQERFASEKKCVSKISALAQLLLLFLIYHEKKPFKKIDLATQFGISAMSVTRVVKELEFLHLVEVQRCGRCDYVVPLGSGMQLYHDAKPYFIDPVQKRIFVTMRDEFLDLPLSGESALAAYSMLNPPAIPCRAIGRKEYRQYQEMGIHQIDPAWYGGTDYIELEIWKYDPVCHAKNGVVDIISLASSFSNTKDERIELAVEEMMEDDRW